MVLAVCAAKIAKMPLRLSGRGRKIRRVIE